MAFERLLYTAAGALSNLRDRPKSVRDTIPISTRKDIPRFVFTYWDTPTSEEEVIFSMNDLHKRFRGLPIGVGLLVRPMGDVVPTRDYAYNPSKLNTFLEAAQTTSTPVFIITSGMHWTEVAYSKSPLLRMLEQNSENLMKYKDGSRVQRKLQPPGNYLRGYFGSDGNGVLYLSHYAEEVVKYRERNLFQLAKAVKPFADERPNLFEGISVENEVDFPSNWITKGKLVDVGLPHKLSDKPDANSETFENLKIRAVRDILQKNVDIFRKAGLTKIYTNQSFEDAENRGSPLSTADIEGSNIGITAWRTGNQKLYRDIGGWARYKNKNWALVISNPLSLDTATNINELRAAIDCQPDIIGLYNWYPHFWGYGIRGMTLEKALKSLAQ